MLLEPLIFQQSWRISIRWSQVRSLPDALQLEKPQAYHLGEKEQQVEHGTLRCGATGKIGAGQKRGRQQGWAKAHGAVSSPQGMVSCDVLVTSAWNQPGFVSVSDPLFSSWTCRWCP